MINRAEIFLEQDITVSEVKLLVLSKKYVINCTYTSWIKLGQGESQFGQNYILHSKKMHRKTWL